MRPAVYIVDGVRTPFCARGSAFASAGAVELGRTVMAALLAKTGLDPVQIDEAIIGASSGVFAENNLARAVALRAGLPATVPTSLVHRACASGFGALTQAAEKIRSGRGDVFLAAGIECSSPAVATFRDSSPLFSRRRWQQILERGSVRARHALRAPHAGTTPALSLEQVQAHERLAREWRIPRDAQDRYAVASHRRAAAGRAHLAEETWPVYLRGQDRPLDVSSDPLIRENQTPDALAQLSVEDPQPGGTITAGNSAPAAEGAVALLVMSEDGLRRSGLASLGRLVDFSFATAERERLGLAPVLAMAALAQRLGSPSLRADIVEIDEACAAQVLACRAAAESPAFARRQMGRADALAELPEERVNVNGGALALGHAAGANSLRLVLAALKELRRRRTRCAMVALGAQSGHGGAAWLEAA